MPVAVDMTFPNRNQGGSGAYARALVDAISSRADVRLSVISAAPGAGFAQTMRWLVRDAAAAVRAARPAIVHCPSFVVPWALGVPFAVTVFDVSTRLFPQDYPAEWRAYERIVVPRRARKASLVVAISDVTRRDAIVHYGLDPDKVITIYPGVDDAFRTVARGPDQSSTPSLLFPGAPIARKNLDAVLDALAAARPETAAARAVLQISGANESAYPRYAARIRSLGLSGRVRWLGVVARDAMPMLVAKATAVVYPSFYEGFGLPPLEAMATGTPVIASNASCLPEVLGDGALLVDPADSGAWTEAIEAVLTQPPLRNRLVAAGDRRAATFTWKRCAEETVAAYRNALAGAP